MKIYSQRLFAICLAVIGFTVGMSAQVKPPTTPDKVKTDLELFQERYGTVFVQAYSKLPAIRGDGGTFQIFVKEFRNPTSSAKTKGLVIEITTFETYSSSARSLVEYAELDSLIKGITYVSKIDKSITTLDNFEAQYKTKDDFTVIVFNGNGKDGKLSVSLRVGTYGAKSIIIPIEKLPDVIASLEAAKAKLDTL